MHGQGQILYRHANLVVGLLGIDGLKYAVPLLVAGHEVVLHHLFCLEIGALPNESSKNDYY